MQHYREIITVRNIDNFFFSSFSLNHKIIKDKI